MQSLIFLVFLSMERRDCKIWIQKKIIQISLYS